MTNPPLMMAGTSPLYDFGDGSYGWGICGMDIDADGAGGNAENDPDWQDTTTLKNADGTSLNMRLEKIFVVPELWVKDLPGIVMGCQGQVTDVLSGLVTPAVPGDVGPSDKAGEASPALATFFGVNPSPTKGGTQQPRFFYRIWPGMAGFVGGKKYQLQRYEA